MRKLGSKGEICLQMKFLESSNVTFLCKDGGKGAVLDNVGNYSKIC